MANRTIIINWKWYRPDLVEWYQVQNDHEVPNADPTKALKKLFSDFWKSGKAAFKQDKVSSETDKVSSEDIIIPIYLTKEDKTDAEFSEEFNERISASYPEGNVLVFSHWDFGLKEIRTGRIQIYHFGHARGLIYGVLLDGLDYSYRKEEYIQSGIPSDIFNFIWSHYWNQNARRLEEMKYLLDMATFTGVASEKALNLLKNFLYNYDSKRFEEYKQFEKLDEAGWNFQGVNIRQLIDELNLEREGDLPRLVQKLADAASSRSLEGLHQEKSYYELPRLLRKA